MLETAARCWSDDLMPKLASPASTSCPTPGLKNKQRKLLRQHFKREIFPALTPLAFDPSHPFPHISNLSINLAVVVATSGTASASRASRCPRFSPPAAHPDRREGGAYERPGLEDCRRTTSCGSRRWSPPTSTCSFPASRWWRPSPSASPATPTSRSRKTRRRDLLEAMEEVVGQRHFGFAVRLEVDSRIPDHIKRHPGAQPVAGVVPGFRNGRTHRQVRRHGADEDRASRPQGRAVPALRRPAPWRRARTSSKPSSTTASSSTTPMTASIRWSTSSAPRRATRRC